MPFGEFDEHSLRWRPSHTMQANARQDTLSDHLKICACVPCPSGGTPNSVGQKPRSKLRCKVYKHLIDALNITCFIIDLSKGLKIIYAVKSLLYQK